MDNEQRLYETVSRSMPNHEWVANRSAECDYVRGMVCMTSFGVVLIYQAVEPTMGSTVGAGRDRKPERDCEADA